MAEDYRQQDVVSSLEMSVSLEVAPGTISEKVLQSRHLVTAESAPAGQGVS